MNAGTDETWHVGALKNVLISFDTINHDRIYGNIGQEEHSLKIGIDAKSLIDFPFDNVTLYQLFLTSRLSLSGISIPVRLKSNRIVGVKTNGDTLELPALFPQNYDIPTPLPTDNPLQKTTEYKSTIIDEIPVSEMKEFIGEFTIETNPDGLNYQQNILEKGAKLTVDFEMDIPMDFSMYNHHQSDTIKFDMFTPDLIDIMHALNLKMIVKNAFPIDADVSVCFLDSAYNRVMIIYEGKISGGEIGADFHVVKPETVNVEIDLLADEVSVLKKVRYISLISTLDTKNNEEVKIFAGSEKEGYLSIKTGARAKFQAGTLVDDYIK
jgi:hypothetical protein